MIAVCRLPAIALIAALLACAVAPPAAADTPDRPAREATVAVAYHFDAGLDQASRGLRNIRNHLIADPQARIAVVALGAGIDFLLKGTKTEGGYPFDAIVEELQMDGVRFKVCNNTLQARGLGPAQVLDDVEIVRSGVAELARLQFVEGHAYIKP